MIEPLVVLTVSMMMQLAGRNHQRVVCGFLACRLRNVTAHVSPC
jgi:hypothetical protein